MGYEVIFSYKESAEKPGEYGDEIKKRTCRIGKTTEDIPLESLAAKIMSQLARRNILIVDVEIYEYAKKKVGYRESSDGIVIKNKKFGFDSGPVVEVDDSEEVSEDGDEDFKPIPQVSKELADRSCPISAAKNSGPAPTRRRVIRHEIYEPEPLAEFKAKQKGLKFTMGKRYPIYSESSMGTTIVYKTTDDSGRDVDVSSEYFVAVGAGLIMQDEGPRYVGAENQKEEINLWGKYENADVPDIRRK
jgi:hypothetical protein